MKKLSLIIVLFFAVVYSSNVFAINFSEEKSELIVNNLVNGINSSNDGLRTSSAFVLYNLIAYDYLSKEDASNAIIPLMKMVRNGKSEEEKIVAALSLYKLGDSRGIYLLKRTALFEKNERVKFMSKNLYTRYHIENGTAFLINM